MNEEARKGIVFFRVSAQVFQHCYWIFRDCENKGNTELDLTASSKAGPQQVSRETWRRMPNWK
jgi:hypothetical protein